MELQIAGESEAIRCTGNHPFWSEDHQDFVRADHLRIGETLRTASGQTQVQSVETIPSQHAVYNIEVFGNHVYHVGTTGVLVHNGDPEDCIKWARKYVERKGGTAFSILPYRKGTNIEQLPDYDFRQNGWPVHAIVIKNGKVFDPLHPNGIAIAEWWGKFAGRNRYESVFEARLFTRFYKGLEAALQWPRNGYF